MTNPPELDSVVVVIGGGPVGQTCALLLARWGTRVVLLDERTEREPVGSKAICQQRDVLDIWSAVGAGEQLAAEGLTWTTVRTFYREDELFSYQLTDAGRARFPPFVNISQSRTEQLLDRAIAAQPLIEVRRGHHVAAVHEHDDNVVLTGVTTDGAAFETAGSYVVACTGLRSDELRGQLGVSFDGFSFDDRFLICDIRAELPGWAAERRFYFDPPWNPGRQVLIHPCPDSTFRIDWQVPSDYSLVEDEATGNLDRRIRAIIDDRPYEIVWKSVYRFQSRIADRMQVGRVLLAGDCAHVVAPFGARGLNSGVADAENAAWKIAFVLHGWAESSLLTSYHDERHAAAQENLAVTTATMNFLVPHDEQQWRIRRDVLEHAATSEQAREQVNSGRLAEPYWYSDSMLTTPAPDRPPTGRPPRGGVPPAAPGVIAPDAPVRIAGTARSRLRELARDGILLLAGAQVDVATVQLALDPTLAPTRMLELEDIDHQGALRAALGARPGELWIIRPDAHIAAVLDRPDQQSVAAAVQRLLGAAVPELTGK